MTAPGVQGGGGRAQQGAGVLDHHVVRAVRAAARAAAGATAGASPAGSRWWGAAPSCGCVRRVVARRTPALAPRLAATTLCCSAYYELAPDSEIDSPSDGAKSGGRSRAARRERRGARSAGGCWGVAVVPVRVGRTGAGFRSISFVSSRVRPPSGVPRRGRERGGAALGGASPKAHV